MDEALRIRSANDWSEFAKRLRYAEKGLRTNVRTAIRDAAKPAAVEAIHQGAQAMPARGGLRALLEQASPLVSITQRGVSVTLRDRGKHDLASLDRGILRHPAGNIRGPRETWKWVAQEVPAGSFTEAFDSKAEELRDPILNAINKTISEVTEGIS